MIGRPGPRLAGAIALAARLRADVELLHFRVLDSSLAALGTGAVERLVQSHLGELTRLIPDLEVPVALEQKVTIGGLEEGVVKARGGVLPLSMKVSEVISVTDRPWIFLEVKAGPWQPSAARARDEADPARRARPCAGRRSGFRIGPAARTGAATAAESRAPGRALRAQRDALQKRFGDAILARGERSALQARPRAA